MSRPASTGCRRIGARRRGGLRAAARLSQMAGRRAPAGLWRRPAARVRHRSGARRRGGRTGWLAAGARTPAHERGQCLRGVYREPAHSPGRVDDDAAIMRRVGEALGGARVSASNLIAADASSTTPSANLFVMCERGDGPRSPGGDGEGGRDRRQFAGRHSQHLPPSDGRAVRATSRVARRSAGSSPPTRTSRGRPTAPGSSATISTRRKPTMSSMPPPKSDGARR